MFWPSGAHLYWIPANWQYDSAHCHFCTSMWTWGTDYVLAIFMARNAYLCLKNSKNSNVHSYSIRRTTAVLFSVYCVSVFTGGLGHHYYTTLDDLNSLSFRILWFICVATVAMAGGIVGVMGSRFGKAYNINEAKILPEEFWIGYGVLMVLISATGAMSYQRPACDTFIAGSTQTFPTFYNLWIMYHIYSLKQQRQATKDIATKHSIAQYLKYSVSYLLNAPPFPIYTQLLHAQIDTSIINTYLHSNLFVTWNCQGYFIRYFIELLEEEV